MRVLLLHNVVNPHMTPVFEALSKRVDLTVAYFAEREADRQWDHGRKVAFDSRVLPGRQVNLMLKWDTLTFHFNPGVMRFLDEARFDVLINAGWMSPANWQAFVYSRRNRRGHVLWSGSTMHEPSLLRTVTAPAVRYMVRRSDAWVAYGTAAAEYLEHMGADPSRIELGYHCVDNERFLNLCERTKPRVPELRQSFGDKPIVLFVGRMLERKGVPELLRAKQSFPDAALVLVGDGPMLQTWRGEVSSPEVHFVGAVKLEELPLYYQAADVFVLPSIEEVWGLVANKAALAGLPLVVSETCGAARDLIEQGVNGYRIPPADAPALVRAISDIMPRRKEMGASSRRIVERFSPENLALSLERASQRAQAAYKR